MESFKASTQYGDWTGSVSADNHDRVGMRDFLKEKGLIKDGEFPISASIWIGENHGERLGRISIQAYIFQGEGHDTIKDAIGKMREPIPVKIIDLDISLEEFFVLFKRFNLFLNARGLGHEGREYSTD